MSHLPVHLTRRTPTGTSYCPDTRFSTARVRRTIEAVLCTILDKTMNESIMWEYISWSVRLPGNILPGVLQPKGFPVNRNPSVFVKEMGPQGDIRLLIKKQGVGFFFF